MAWLVNLCKFILFLFNFVFTYLDALICDMFINFLLPIAYVLPI